MKTNGSDHPRMGFPKQTKMFFLNSSALPSPSLPTAVHTQILSAFPQQTQSSQENVRTHVPLLLNFRVPVLMSKDMHQVSSDGVNLLFEPCRVIGFNLSSCNT